MYTIAAEFIGLPVEVWGGAVAGAALSGLLLPTIAAALAAARRWWLGSRPPRRLLEGLADNSEPCHVFMRDFQVERFDTPQSPLISVEPRWGIGRVQNVADVWPDVDAMAFADVLNVLGAVGKTRNIEVVRMSQDQGIWDSNIVVIGAQTQKCADFYGAMKNVFYRVTATQIIESELDAPIGPVSGYGYGIILKARNPHKTRGRPGVGLLIGGLGVLGTEAAGYYFRMNYHRLGKEFGSRCFGVVVRAAVTAGYQAVERIPEFDRAEPKSVGALERLRRFATAVAARIRDALESPAEQPDVAPRLLPAWVVIAAGLSLWLVYYTLGLRAMIVLMAPITAGVALLYLLIRRLR